MPELDVSDVIVGLVVGFYGIGQGFAKLQSWGIFPKPNGNGHDNFKKSGDLTVESFEAKIRHLVRNELSVIGTPLHELSKSNNEIMLGIREMVTILKERR